MIRRIIYLLVCVVIVGCDSFPGPVLRNEYSTEIKVTILYDDGTRYSESWPPCRTVSIGATEVGRFGLKEKSVSVDEITIESENEVVQRFDKKTIDALLKKAIENQGHPIWVVDSSGIRFSTDKKCSVNQGER